MDKKQIDTANLWALGGLGDGNIVVGLPPQRLTPDQALLFAAYLVLMAEADAKHSFADVLTAVSDT